MPITLHIYSISIVSKILTIVRRSQLMFILLRSSESYVSVPNSQTVPLNVTTRVWYKLFSNHTRKIVNGLWYRLIHLIAMSEAFISTICLCIKLARFGYKDPQKIKFSGIIEGYRNNILSIHFVSDFCKICKFSKNVYSQTAPEDTIVTAQSGCHVYKSKNVQSMLNKS